MEILKLAAILALIITAIRLKVSVGVTLIVAGVLTGLLFGASPSRLLGAYVDLAKSGRFLFLVSVVLLVSFLGALLQEMKYLDRLVTGSDLLPGGKRTSAGLLPFLVGLMPMPAGSLLSAPLVGQVLSDPKYTPEFRTVTNYWMRHQVEFFWPIYPGIILSAAITGLPIGSVALLQLPLGLCTGLLGTLLFLRRIHVGEQHRSDSRAALIEITRGIWPVAAAIAIFAITGIELAWALIMAIGLLLVVGRPSPRLVLASARRGFSYKLVVLVLGALGFQSVLELTGAVEAIPALAAGYDVPPQVLVFAVCFIVGMLTGMVAAYVALGYAILAGFLYQPELQPANMLLAYLSGFAGMMLSPTHLCLVLTNEYFGGDLGKVYRKLAIPVVLLVLFGLGLHFSGWGRLFL